MTAVKIALLTHSLRLTRSRGRLAPLHSLAGLIVLQQRGDTS